MPLLKTILLQFTRFERDPLNVMVESLMPGYSDWWEKANTAYMECVFYYRLKLSFAYFAGE